MLTTGQVGSVGSLKGSPVATRLRRAQSIIVGEKREAPSRDESEEDEEDDEYGLVNALKRTKISALKAVPVAHKHPQTKRVRLQKTATALGAESSDDDLDAASANQKRLGRQDSNAPANHFADDAASDYWPSDSDDKTATSHAASALRRTQRAQAVVTRMAAFFSQTMPTASRALFDPSSGLPFHVVARLRKWVGPEDEVDESYGFGKLDNRTQPLPKKKSRWSEKGPVVLMILPCSEERPWEARVVAHYTFGIQTAAVNMPISDVHASYLRQLTPKKLILSSLGQNIQAHAIISSQPRRIHDFLSNVSQHDLKVLKNMPKSGDAKHSELTMAVAERLEAVSLDANQMPRRIATISKSTRAAASIAASASRARESKNEDSGNESSDTSGRVTPEPKSDAAKGKGRKMRDPVAMNPDFILECKSTIVPIKEDSSSVFMFAFDQKNDCTAFTSRFLKAVTDYSAYLTEKRTSTFVTPQLVKRVLLSGQTVLLPGSTLCSTSPFAHEPLLARQIAETGLMYLPTLTPDNQVQHRLVCTHCHAALAVCTASTCAPGFEAVCSAHAGHSFAKRGGEVVGKGKKAAVADARGAVYWCVYALKWVGAGGSGGLEGCVGNMGKKGWDLVVVN